MRRSQGVSLSASPPPPSVTAPYHVTYDHVIRARLSCHVTYDHVIRARFVAHRRLRDGVACLVSVAPPLSLSVSPPSFRPSSHSFAINPPPPPTVSFSIPLCHTGGRITEQQIEDQVTSPSRPRRAPVAPLSHYHHVPVSRSTSPTQAVTVPSTSKPARSRRSAPSHSPTSRVSFLSLSLPLSLSFSFSLFPTSVPLA